MTPFKSLALLTLIGCSLVGLNHFLRLASSPGFEALPDHQLALLRGADSIMWPMHVFSCEDEAKSAYGTLGGTNYVGASECSDTNSRTTCVKCEEQASREFGVDMGPAPPGTGSQRSSLTTSCGRLKRGTCGAIPGTMPVKYGCLNPSFVLNPYGEPYSCSDLFGYMEDQSTET